MDFNNSNVIFLEMKDFKGDVLTIKGKPFPGTVIVMVQGSFCGYCTQAKPDFIKLANEFGSKSLSNNSIVFATVKIDGDQEEQVLGKALPELTGQPISGVPAYLIYKNGRFAHMHKGGRDYKSLKKAIGM